MNNLAIEGNRIYLPKNILKKFSGKKLELIETHDGILIKVEPDTIKETRGILKGSHFNSKSYFAQKQVEKGLDR
jgi:hypothetical protein